MISSFRTTTFRSEKPVYGRGCGGSYGKKSRNKASTGLKAQKNIFYDGNR
jgi:hypothetical protein